MSNRFMSRWTALVRILLPVFLLFVLSHRAYGDTIRKDDRSWDETVASFLSSAQVSHDGLNDGEHLYALNPMEARHLFSEYLPKRKPLHVRVKVVDTLGWINYGGKVPELAENLAVLCEIARDKDEFPVLRRIALDPCLRYIDEEKALGTAIEVIMTDPNPNLRLAAAWSISGHNSERAVYALRDAFQANLLERYRFLQCLSFVSHPKRWDVVLDTCPLESVKSDPAQLFMFLSNLSGCERPEVEKTVFSFVSDADNDVAICALGHFSKHPLDKLVAPMIAYAKRKKLPSKSQMLPMIKTYLASPDISKSNKKRLQKLLDGKIVVEPPPAVI